MQFFKFLGLIFLLIVSWNVIHSKPATSDLEHFDIQRQVKQIITDYVLQNNSDAAEVKFIDLWSKNLTDKTLSVHFKYKINEKSSMALATNLTLTGNVIVKKQVVSGVSQWSMEDIKLLDEKIEFQNPVLITPGDKDAG